MWKRWGASRAAGATVVGAAGPMPQGGMGCAGDVANEAGSGAIQAEMGLLLEASQCVSQAGSRLHSLGCPFSI